MAIIRKLIIEERGAFISKYQGRLQVKQGKTVLKQAPLMHLQQVLITGKAVSLSSDVIEACAERGIPLFFIDFTGRPYASLYAAGLTETVKTRRAQMKAYDNDRGLAVSQAFATAKINNQAALLHYMAKYKKEKQPDIYKAVKLLALETKDGIASLETTCRQHTTLSQLRPRLLGIEGQAAKKYWEGIKLLVKGANDWRGRTGRGATDPLNAALNYGYGILYGQIERAIVLAGLDPYAGFIHVDRPGKPSLVLDLIEEFRQPIVDRSIFALFNQGTRIELDEKHQLNSDSRQRIVNKVLERLEKPEKYEGKRSPLRIIIQNQARHLATFVRGDRENYKGFIVKW